MEKEMIKKVLDFSEYTVEEIMVPLSNVAVISLHATLDEAAAVVKERNYSRIPVYDREVLNIVGIIDSFDLMDDLARRGKDAPLVPEENGDGRVRRQILFVPETKRARDLFLELQRHGEHMAVVVDEYGGAVGIITMEDIQEEIVGDINDEDHDSAATLIRPSGRGRYTVDGQVKTDYLQTTLGVTVPEGDYETVGGFLLAAMGKIPKPRESYRLGNIVFVVEEADLRSIKKILLLIPPEVSVMKQSDPMP
jgi:CBS domain containing-hemolysin-like protein